MKTVARSAFIAVVFVIGCAAGGAASGLGGAANAQPAPPAPAAPRWAYFCFKGDDPDRIRDTANQAGAQGWELAASALSGANSVSSPIWCFKRPY